VQYIDLSSEEEEDDDDYIGGETSGVVIKGSAREEKSKECTCWLYDFIYRESQRISTAH
jgi:hypothetical protein